MLRHRDMRDGLEAASAKARRRRSATQVEEEGPEGRGSSVCNSDLEFREVRAGCHASHARVAQMLQVSMYTDTAGPREW